MVAGARTGRPRTTPLAYRFSGLISAPSSPDLSLGSGHREILNYGHSAATRPKFTHELRIQNLSKGWPQTSDSTSRSTHRPVADLRGGPRHGDDPDPFTCPDQKAGSIPIRRKWIRHSHPQAHKQGTLKRTPVRRRHPIALHVHGAWLDDALDLRVRRRARLIARLGLSMMSCLGTVASHSKARR